jgi:hypothetical protein
MPSTWALLSDVKGAQRFCGTCSVGFTSRITTKSCAAFFRLPVQCERDLQRLKPVHKSLIKHRQHGLHFPPSSFASPPTLADMDDVFSLTQTIFKTNHPDAQVVAVHVNDLTEEHLYVPLALAKQDGGVVGLAPSFGSGEILSTLAIATSSLVLIIKFSETSDGGKGKKKKKAKNVNVTGVRLLEQIVLCSHTIVKVAFQMDVVATALYLDRGLHIVNAVDILSLPATTTARHSLAKLMQALGGEGQAYKAYAQRMLQTIAGAGEFSSQDIAHQAWVARHAAQLKCNSNLCKKAPRINTVEMNKEVSTRHLRDRPAELIPEKKLKVIAKTVRDACRLDSLKPTRVQNEITDKTSIKKGQLNVQSSRFSTRVMKLSSEQVSGFDMVVLVNANHMKHLESGNLRFVRKSPSDQQYRSSRR